MLMVLTLTLTRIWWILICGSWKSKLSLPWLERSCCSRIIKSPGNRCPYSIKCLRFDSIFTSRSAQINAYERGCDTGKLPRLLISIDVVRFVAFITLIVVLKKRSPYSIFRKSSEYSVIVEIFYVIQLKFFYQNLLHIKSMY